MFLFFIFSCGGSWNWGTAKEYQSKHQVLKFPYFSLSFYSSEIFIPFKKIYFYYFWLRVCVSLFAHRYAHTSVRTH